jgi:hypothetical protein
VRTIRKTGEERKEDREIKEKSTRDGRGDTSPSGQQESEFGRVWLIKNVYHLTNKYGKWRSRMQMDRNSTPPNNAPSDCTFIDSA